MREKAGKCRILLKIIVRAQQDKKFICICQKKSRIFAVKNTQPTGLSLCGAVGAARFLFSEKMF